MPHYKCTACRTRLHLPTRADDHVGDLCPECGALLEPVGNLSELLGFRSIRRLDYVGEADGADRHQLIAARAYDFLGYRDRAVSRARMDTDRWDGEGGHLAPEPYEATFR